MKRNRIGIIYESSDKWIGGAYYIQNIISSLNLVDDSLRPDIFVFAETEDSFNELKEASSYPYLHFVNHGTQLRRLLRFLNKLFFKLTGHKYWLIDKYQTKNLGLAFVYPIQNHIPLNYSKTCISWIPDFQHKYLPQLFSEKEITHRDSTMKTACQSGCAMVFSSKDAQSDYYKFQTDAKNPSYVLPFTVTHPDFSNEDIVKIKNKYGIRGEYLFCANQYWTHKNHKFLYSAFFEAKKKGLQLQLVCSGKMHDYRNPSYADELQSFITTNGFNTEIINVGFISRTEQLCLMKNSYAIIQPSLFEGWNTTVEDAKCLNKFIFLSELNVHLEQAPVNVCYFDPHKEEDLVEKLLTVKPTNHSYDYMQDKVAQGQKWAQIIKEVCERNQE